MKDEQAEQKYLIFRSGLLTGNFASKDELFPYIFLNENEALS